MSSGIRLIVGLGNPGEEYENTRHNAGAWFVLELAKLAKTTLRFQNKFHGLHCIAKFNQEECHLLIPTTYMNHSGQAVTAVANYYKINPEKILIAHDEVDLSVGDIRLKYNGGHGGHNGLRDIMAHLNSTAFHRLRIGVGHPGNSKEVVDYVLHPPKKSEREAIDQSLENVYSLLPFLFSGEFQKATQKLNTKG